jgi:hypothetical protein
MTPGLPEGTQHPQPPQEETDCVLSVGSFGEDRQLNTVQRGMDEFQTLANYRNGAECTAEERDMINRQLEGMASVKKAAAAQNQQNSPDTPTMQESGPAQARQTVPETSPVPEMTPAQRMQRQEEERQAKKAEAGPSRQHKEQQPPPPKPADFPALDGSQATLRPSTAPTPRPASYAAAAQSARVRHSVEFDSAGKASTPAKPAQSSKASTPRFAQPTKSVAIRETLRKDAKVDSPPSPGKSSRLPLLKPRTSLPEAWTAREGASKSQSQSQPPPSGSFLGVPGPSGGPDLDGSHDDEYDDPAPNTATRRLSVKPPRGSFLGDTGPLGQHGRSGHGGGHNGEDHIPPSPSMRKTTTQTSTGHVGGLDGSYDMVDDAPAPPTIRKKPSSYIAPTAAATQRTIATLGKEHTKHISPRVRQAPAATPQTDGTFDEADHIPAEAPVGCVTPPELYQSAQGSPMKSDPSTAYRTAPESLMKLNVDASDLPAGQSTSPTKKMKFQGVANTREIKQRPTSPEGLMKPLLERLEAQGFLKGHESAEVKPPPSPEKPERHATRPSPCGKPKWSPRKQKALDDVVIKARQGVQNRTVVMPPHLPARAGSTESVKTLSSQGTQTLPQPAATPKASALPQINPPQAQDPKTAIKATDEQRKVSTLRADAKPFEPSWKLDPTTTQREPISEPEVLVAPRGLEAELKQLNAGLEQLPSFLHNGLLSEGLGARMKAMGSLFHHGLVAEGFGANLRKVAPLFHNGLVPEALEADSKGMVSLVHNGLVSESQMDCAPPAGKRIMPKRVGRRMDNLNEYRLAERQRPMTEARRKTLEMMSQQTLSLDDLSIADPDSMSQDGGFTPGTSGLTALTADYHPLYLLPAPDSVRGSKYFWRTKDANNKMQWNTIRADGSAGPAVFAMDDVPPYDDFRKSMVRMRAAPDAVVRGLAPFILKDPQQYFRWQIQPDTAAHQKFGWAGGDGKEIRFTGHGQMAEYNPNAPVSMHFYPTAPAQQAGPAYTGKGKGKATEDAFHPNAPAQEPSPAYAGKGKGKAIEDPDSTPRPSTMPAPQSCTTPTPKPDPKPKVWPRSQKQWEELAMKAINFPPRCGKMQIVSRTEAPLPPGMDPAVAICNKCWSGR